jgi:charged multivesicular body protein 3
METINRFLYGPTPEERVRAWQAKLRSESRQLDREMKQVHTPQSLHVFAIDSVAARNSDEQGPPICETASNKGGC